MNDLSEQQQKILHVIAHFEAIKGAIGRATRLGS
jgi:hypothetical protein